jgi:hypothetical protein
MCASATASGHLTQIILVAGDHAHKRQQDASATVAFNKAPRMALDSSTMIFCTNLFTSEYVKYRFVH